MFYCHTVTLGSSKSKVPAQVVLPDKSVAIGLPPTGLAKLGENTVNGTSGTEEDETGSVLVCLSASSEIDYRINARVWEFGLLIFSIAITSAYVSSFLFPSNTLFPLKNEEAAKSSIWRNLGKTITILTALSSLFSYIIRSALLMVIFGNMSVGVGAIFIVSCAISVPDLVLGASLVLAGVTIFKLTSVIEPRMVLIQDRQTISGLTGM